MPLCVLVKQLKHCSLPRTFHRLLCSVDILVVSEDDVEYKIERALDHFQGFLILGSWFGHALQKSSVHSG